MECIFIKSSIFDGMELNMGQRPISFPSKGPYRYIIYFYLPAMIIGQKDILTFAFGSLVGFRANAHLKPGLPRYDWKK